MELEIQNAISELGNDLDNFIKNNEKQLEEIKINMMKNEKSLAGAMPMGNTTEHANMKADFAGYIRKGDEVIFKKSLNEKNGDDGGHMLPHEIVNQINEQLKILSPMRAIANVITISTNSVDIIVDSKVSDANWVAASSETRDETDSPKIEKIKIPVHEIYAKPKANQHLLDDTQINVEEWLINKIAEKIATLENNAFINGSGTNCPKGFLKYTSDNKVDSERDFGKLQHFSTGADGKFSSDVEAVNLLVDMVCSLKPKYAKRAKWIMSRSALAVIRKLKNSDGVFLWQPSLSESTPATLLGYPVIIDDDMPALVDGTASVSVAFGDFQSGYQIVDRQGLKILRDPYTSKPFVEFYASKRCGGALVDSNAIKLLKFTEAE